MLTKLNNIKINNDYRDITIQGKLILSPNYGKNGFKNIILCVQLSSSIILTKGRTGW